ncbi:MAG: LPS export ABC transporter permease LptF [Syntrophales bacterium]
MARIINRYIFREIAVPFGMTLFILTFVLLMGKIVQLVSMMVNRGVGFLDVVLLILYLIPSFLVYTVPVSLLVAILIGLGRLSGDNEITVLKSAGLSLYQLALPVAVFAGAAFLFTAAVTFHLVPSGNSAAKKLVYQVAQQRATLGIKEKVFVDDFRGILIYADRIRDKAEYLEGVIISDNRITGEPSTIFARRAYLLADPVRMVIILRLYQGSTHTVDAGLQNYRKLDFEFYDVTLDLMPALASAAAQKSSTEMTAGELLERIRKAGIDPAALRELAIELNKKMTIPVSCLCFGLLGIPLGIRAHRSVKSRGITVGFLIALAYYLILMGGEALAELGRIPPAVGTWAPNILFGALGIVLFFLAARERPVQVPERAAEIFRRWREKREKRRPPA